MDRRRWDLVEEDCGLALVTGMESWGRKEGKIWDQDEGQDGCDQNESHGVECGRSRLILTGDGR